MKSTKEYLNTCVKDLLIEMPTTLYHYTSAHDEIIHSNKFRLTNYGCFKGDANEFKWGLDFLEKTIGLFYPKLYAAIREYSIKIFERQPYYVGCFCKNSENEFLINNYGNPVSFKFDVVHKPIIVGHVIYEMKWIQNVVDDIFQLLDNYTIEDIILNRQDLVKIGLTDDNPIRAWILIENITHLLPFVKHNDFVAEDEIRMVCIPDKYNYHEKFYDIELDGTFGIKLELNK